MEENTSTLHTGKLERTPTCDVCGIPASDAVRLVDQDGQVICRPHALEEAAQNERDAEMARHLAPLLQHRYKHDPDRFLRDLSDLAGLRGPIILALVNGQPWEEAVNAPGDA